MKLNKKQTQAWDYLDDPKVREVFFGGAAGGGKSILLTLRAAYNCLHYPDTVWLLGRSKLKTLKETTLRSFFKVCALTGIPPTAYTYNQQAGTITFDNKSMILLKDLFLYPSDPEFDELGSLEITGAMIDEVSQVTEKAWNVVRSRIRHNLKPHDLTPKILGTCNPTKNFVYRKGYKPWKEGKETVDTKFVQALVTDNPDIDPHYIENLESLDEMSRERLLHGNWEYDTEGTWLFEYEKIIEAFTEKKGKHRTGTRYITVDVARYGQDKTILRVWDGWESIDKIVMDRSSVRDVVGKIKHTQVQYHISGRNTIVDEDGVGGGVVDYADCEGFANGGSPMEENGAIPNYQNLRTQCYFKLAEKVNQGAIHLHDEGIERNPIAEELEAIEEKNVGEDSRRKISTRADIEAKIGRSPDEASALMMRAYFDLRKKRKTSKNKLLTRCR